MASRLTPGYTSPITLQLVGPQSWTEVPALLCYDPTDPFAVRIAFGDSDDDPDGAITWLLSRELLQTGLESPAGDGDVRLWPAKAAADVLYLHLRAPCAGHTRTSPSPEGRSSPLCRSSRLTSQAMPASSTSTRSRSSPTSPKAMRTANGSVGS